MSSYTSRWTGQQIDNSVDAIAGQGLTDVVGIIQRTDSGAFVSAKVLSAVSSGTDVSVVTTGEKYNWNNKISNTEKGVSNGLATLDANGKVPSSQLPSYVDDVLEFDSKSAFPADGEKGKIYVDKATNLTYRWGGTAYAEISPSIALGETSSTAYRGDRGKIAYDHANSKGSAFSSGLYKITTNSEGHVTAATAVVKSDITGLQIPGQDTTYTFTPANPSLDWNERYKIGTVTNNINNTSTDFYITMPSNPNTNTTYSFASGTNGFTVTPSNGTAQTITITPSIANNITGSGTSGNLAKFSDANTITSGPALGTDSTKFLNNKGEWAAPINTTYESKSASNISTEKDEVSLVTRGEKYIWNDKLSPSDLGVSVAPLNNGKIDKNYLPELSKVTITRNLTSGTQIATIEVDSTSYNLFAPNPTSVSVTQRLTSGIKIATISVNGVETDIYGTDSSGSWAVNTKDIDGYVPAPTSTNANKTWATDSEGNPGWRDYNSGSSSVTIQTADGIIGGPITSTGTLKANLMSYTKLSASSVASTDIANRTYPVLLDKDGHLAVNIPWENTTYQNRGEAQGGQDLSLVTTGEKYNWNHKVGAVSVTKTTQSGTKSGTITIDGTSTDLFYDVNIRAAALNGVTNANTNSGDTYLNLVENGAYKTGLHLIPGFNMSITSNAEGSITFSTLSKITKTDTSITLNVENWNNQTQTITLQGITDSNTIIITPAPSSVDSYSEAAVRCTSQTTNTLTFECNSTPTSNLIVNVLVLEEKTS